MTVARASFTEVAPRTAAARWWSDVGWGGLGGLLGGLLGGAVVVVITLGLKASFTAVSMQRTWILIATPLFGLALTVGVLQLYGLRRVLPRSTKRQTPTSDITGDVIETAGEEEKFPWWLAPIRAIAVWATVGLGNAMGTEAPAAYFGVATGAWLGDRGRRWRRILRPAALGGGAAGVAALMAIPLVGTAYLLELGRRHRAPFSAERVTAAVVGGLVGWGINVAFHLNLIRLVVPKEPPDNFLHSAEAALIIGALSGAVSALAGAAIYRGKKWKARPLVRLAVGGVAAAVIAILLVHIATPTAAVGPGTGAILWAEQDNALPRTMLWVALLRGAATAAAAAAGGCGGIFVPFLCVGDLAGRVVGPGLGVGHDLAGSAGAAGGLAGGYHLPLTAIATVLGVGGPRLATLTCLAAVIVAYYVGLGVELLVRWGSSFKR